MTDESACPECGAHLMAEARRGICPRCLLRLALTPLPADEARAEEKINRVDPGMAAGPMPPPYHQLGDYELLEEVGHGGMGVIFKARQRGLDRIVALKLIRSGSFAKPNDIARFRTEAAAAARLHHPNIVAIYEVGEHSGQHFYSMEFVPGHSLAAELRLGPMSVSVASRLLREVAEAIHFAHQRGVLHRDLKPSNILLGAEGKPRVADFGLAKILQTDTDMTLSGAVIGSPQYMPPEQARGRSARTGPTSDVYSLGAIFYEMLTGRSPFTAATPLETMQLVVEQEPIAPRRLNSALPRDLETICLKCLAKEPEARFGSAQELADELGRFLNDEPIRSRPVNLLERSWRWCRRRPALASLAAVLALAPMIIIVVLLVMGTKVSGERNRALRQQEITRQNLYAEDISLAWRALQDNDYGAAWRALAAHIPSNSDFQPPMDLRGFEWRWLWQRAQGDAHRTFQAHLGPVFTATYSADGRWMASASADGTVKLWDAANERWLRTLAVPGLSPRASFTDAPDEFGPGNVMRSASFTSDNRQLLSGSHRELSLWDAASGTLLWSFSTPKILDMVLCSPIDPDLALAFPGYPRTNLYVLNLRTRAITPLLSNARADAIAFDPGGRRFARWDREAGSVCLQSFPDGKDSGSFKSSGAYVAAMVFTPDARTLALANMRKDTVELFDVATQNKVGELAGPLGRMLALAISPDGKLLASGGADQSIHLWDLEAMREVRRLEGHRSAVSALGFSSDSRRLASGGVDGTVRFWNVATASLPPQTLTNVMEVFAFSSDGSRLITQSIDGEARVWELPSLRLLQAWAAPRFASAVFNLNDELILAGCGASNQPPWVLSVAAAPNATNVNLRTAAPAASHQNADPPPPRRRIELADVSAACSAIVLAPNGRTVVTGHQDGTVALWDGLTGQLRQRFDQEFSSPNHPGAVEALSISADNRTLAAARFTSVLVKTWLLTDGRRLGSGATGAIYPLALAMSPDGKLVATGGSGQGPNVNVWDTTLQTRLMRLRGHFDHVTALAFAQDGRTLATASVDGTVRLWHLATQRDVVTLLRLEPGDQVNSLVFSPDGLWLGAVTRSHLLHLFHAPVEPLEMSAD